MIFSGEITAFYMASCRFVPAIGWYKATSVAAAFFAKFDAFERAELRGAF